MSRSGMISSLCSSRRAHNSWTLINRKTPPPRAPRIQSKTSTAPPNSALVLAFGDLQIEGGTLAVDHDRSGVQQLLTGTIVGGEAAHRAEWKEKFDRLRTRTAGDVNHTAENDAIEVRILRKIIRHRPHQMRNMVIEGQGRQFVARRARGRIDVGSNGQLQVGALTKPNEGGSRVRQEMRFLVEVLGHARDRVIVLALQFRQRLRG